MFQIRYFNFWDKPALLITSVAYLSILCFLGDLAPLHGIVIGGAVFLYYFNSKTRHFFNYAWPLLASPLVYDLLRYYYIDFITGSVRVSEPYELEKMLFGISTSEGRETLNEFFVTHHYAILDLVCGVAYITFLFQLIGTFLYFYFKNYLSAARILALSFLCVNLLGFITYFVYPSAPPWYVATYGLGPALMQVGPNPAGALRFDALVGFPVFQSFYGQSHDVFGTLPSLHVAYPLLIAILCWNIQKFRIASITYFVLMCFSAVYLQHHYMIDILLGVIYAILIYLVFWSLYRQRLR